MAPSEAEALAAAESDEDTPIGRTLDQRYRIDTKIGAGGVGAVYRATHLLLGQPVAIKLLLDHYGSHPALRKRFEREAKALAALAHPNIVAVTDYGLSGDTPYLVMELLEGVTLAQHLRQARPSPAETLQLTRNLLRALAFVHEHGLVHRDLKPGNVFLQRLPDGETRLKLLDFGLAKFLEKDAESKDATLTRSGDIVGTPAYMAPEQVVGDATDARTDIYSVGIVLFAMVAGRLPYQGDPTDQLRAHLIEPLPPLAQIDPTQVAHPALEALLQRAASKAREDRFQSASEMLRALEEIPQPWAVPAQAGEVVQQTSSIAVASTVAEVHDDAPTRLHDSNSGSRASENKSETESETKSKTTVRTTRKSRVPFLFTCIVLAALAYFVKQKLSASEAATLAAAGSEAAGSAWAAAREALPSAAALQVPPDSAGASPAGAASAPVATATNTATTPAADTAQATTSTTADAAAVPAEPTAAAAMPIATGATPSVANVANVTTTAERPAARNPWARAIPRELKSLRKALQRGERGNDRTISTLRRYNREHAEDPRGHLLLAQLYSNRDWRADVLNQLTTAYQRDPGSRGAPEMLGKLVDLVAQGPVSAEAAAFIRTAYGAEAVAALERASHLPRYDAEAVARLQTLRQQLGP